MSQSVYLKKKIEQLLKIHGEDSLIDTVVVNISTAKHSFKINQDIYILNNSELDIALTAKLVIESADNTLVTSKTEFEAWTDHRYQVFKGNIDITISNYGAVLTPYQLEFIKISPLRLKAISK